MGVPQIIVVIMLTMSFVVHAFKHGETTIYHLGWITLEIMLWVGLLWWGGFWSG